MLKLLEMTANVNMLVYFYENKITFYKDFEESKNVY